MYSVTFLHPDLGIGGAERAIVDAAMALKGKGLKVKILTNHHDINHCFDETKNGDLEVTVAGDFIPRSFLGRFCAAFAYLRFIYLSIYFLFNNSKCDLVYVDQITVSIPILRLFRQKVLFYAHFPDFLLSKEEGKLKRIYRYPINFMEKISLSFANVVLFNSKFTKNVYLENFDCVNKICNDILYPVPNFANLRSLSNEDSLANVLAEDAVIFLSINRYEEKKNIQLAIESFAQLKEWVISEGNSFDNIHLVHMGGYDQLVLENYKTYEHLMYWVTAFRIMDNVHLLKSCSNDEKVNYLKRATALLYTPSNEHFGIVPIEAMYLGLPVIAVNSGGPLETVIDDETGFLRPSQAVEFALAQKKFLDNPELKRTMGRSAQKHVLSNFSFNSFQNKLFRIVEDTIKDGTKKI